MSGPELVKILDGGFGVLGLGALEEARGVALLGLPETELLRPFGLFCRVLPIGVVACSRSEILFDGEKPTTALDRSPVVPDDVLGGPLSC